MFQAVGHNHSPNRYPALQPRNPIIKLPKRIQNGSAVSPRLRKDHTASSCHAEKVVKPPNTPVPRINRTLVFGVAAASTPIRNAPVMLTPNVVAALAPNRTEAAYLNTDPTAPPSATKIKDLALPNSIL